MISEAVEIRREQVEGRESPQRVPLVSRSCQRLPPEVLLG